MADTRKKITSLLRDGDEFFCQDKEEIRDKNTAALKSVSLVFTLILLVYGVLVLFLFPRRQLWAIYGVCLVLQLLFDAAMWRLTRQKRPTFHGTQALCYIQCLLIISFAVLISVFPYPDRPAIFFPPVLVGLSVVFILPLRKLLLSLTACTVVFCVLAVCFKVRSALSYDLWGALPACVIALFCAVNTARLRVDDYRSRMRWMRLSIIDKPTGLLNKAAVEDACRRFFQARGTEPCALLMLDMDCFKGINDGYGHPMGDEVIRRVGVLLQRGFEEDIVGRIGGDEFLILLREIPDRRAERCAAELVERVAQPFSHLRRPRVTCSIGLAIAEAGDDFDTLFAHADQAMYRAKNQGKNRWELWEADREP